MKRLLHLLTLLLLSLPLIGQSPVTVDSLDARGFNWQLGLQATQRSNSLDNEFLRILTVGGHLTPEIIAGARAEMRNFGSLTLNGDFTFALENAANGKGWRVNSGIISDIRWTPELFELVFTGNAPHLGRWDVLNGTRGRAWQLNTIQRTGQWSNDRNVLEWAAGVTHRSLGAVSDVRTGYLWVSGEVDTLYTSLYARSAVERLSAWGPSGQIRFTHLDPASKVSLTLQASQLGLLRVPAGTERISIDTVLATTGLPLTGPGWSIESLQDEDFEESLIIRDTLGGHWDVLPAVLQASLSGGILPGLAWEVRGTVGGWRPVPEAMAGLQIQLGRRASMGIRAIYGGWGKFRPAVWTAFPVGPEHTLTIYAEDPVATFQNSGLGRGVAVQLSRNITAGKKR